MSSSRWWEIEAFIKSGKYTESQVKAMRRLQEIEHNKQEEIRASLGYSGGADGSKIIVKDETLFKTIASKLINVSPDEQLNNTISENEFMRTGDAPTLLKFLTGSGGSQYVNVIDGLSKTIQTGMTGLGTPVSESGTYAKGTVNPSVFVIAGVMALILLLRK